MLFLCLTLLMVAALLLRFNPARPDIRWLAFFLVAWALGALGYFVEDYVSPSEAALAYWLTVRSTLKLLSDSASPYAFLMFSIVYSNAARRWLRLWIWLLPMPLIYVYYLMPHPLRGDSYTILSAYFVPYYIAGFILLISAWLRERNLSARREKLAAATLVVPPVLTYTFFDNYVKSLSSMLYLRYLPLLLSATLFLFFFAMLASKQGVLSVRLILRRQIMDETRRGIATGTMMINHALKNRLTNIELLARDAREQAAGTEVEENMSLVLSETKQMKQLVLQIQKRVEEIRLTMIPCDIGELLRDAAAAHQVALAEKGIDLRIDAPEGVGENVLADPVHLQEVFGNLIRNAMEAIRGGGGVRLKLSRSADEVEVRVTDNGEGLNVPDPGRIFEPFYSTKANADNFGLGLSYCSAVIRKHGGTIDAQGRPGEGTTIVVRLPARPSGRSRGAKLLRPEV